MYYTSFEIPGATKAKPVQNEAIQAYDEEKTPEKKYRFRLPD